MLQQSLVGKVLLQALGVGTYFALVAALYWRRRWDVGAVARSPSVELLKTVSFLAVGMGLVMDLRFAVDHFIVPDRNVYVTILLTVMFVFIAGATCCFIRFITAVKYWGRS
jgi:hypothetical protein